MVTMRIHTSRQECAMRVAVIEDYPEIMDIVTIAFETA